MPVISVIIPVYNGEKYIKKTIESVINQTFNDWELIIINDGSTDWTLDIVNSINDLRIKLFSYKNAGLATSRNRGINHATGEFIAFLDADDLWHPHKLEAQFKALQENPQAAVAYSWTDYIDESDEFLCPGSQITLNGDVYSELLVKNFLENGSNPLIRKYALEEVGGFDETLRAAEDWDMWLRLATTYDFVAVPSTQILYRIYINSMSSNLDRQEAECLKVIERGFNRRSESLQSLKKKSVSNLYEYLMFRTLVGDLNRQVSLSAARYFCLTVSNDPGILKRRSRLMAIVLLKIFVGILLPHQQANRFLEKIKNLFRIDSQ